jgi:ketosteroid isomerase-like protein
MTQPSSGAAASHEGIATTNRKFEEAFNGGDPGRAAREVYTQDARVLPPGAPMITGRENVVGFWKTAAQQLRVERVKLSTQVLEVHGDCAHEIGQATLSMAEGRETVAKYVVIWKQEDGQWRWHIDIWNMNE